MGSIEEEGTFGWLSTGSAREADMNEFLEFMATN